MNEQTGLALTHVPACTLCMQTSMTNVVIAFQIAAVELMKQLSNSTSRHAKHLLTAVRFNIGRAYFQGYGVPRQSDSEAEKCVGKM